MSEIFETARIAVELFPHTKTSDGTIIAALDIAEAMEKFILDMIFDIHTMGTEELREKYRGPSIPMGSISMRRNIDEQDN